MKALFDHAIEEGEAWWLYSFLERMVEDLIGVEEAAKLLAEEEKK
jgi:hypothetical protein